MIGRRPIYFFTLAQFVFATFVHGQAVTENQRPAASEGGSEAIISEKDSVELVGDSSVGESIGRRPDLSFENVTINGQGSGMSLGSIPADAVESVEVMKAVTPDLDADTRNGAISLKTKPTYEQQLVAKGTLELEYKASDESFSNEEIFSWGGRLNEAGTLGGRINFRMEKDFFQIDTISHDWTETDVNSSSEFVLSETEIESFHRDSDEFEVGGNIDFKLSETISLSARGNWEKVDRHFYSPQLNFQYSDGSYDSVDGSTTSVSGATVQRRMNVWDHEEEESESSLGGVFENDMLEAEVQFVFIEEESFQPNFFQLDFRQPDVDLVYDVSNPTFPMTTVTNGRDINNASAFEFEDLNAQKAWLDSESESVSTIDFKFKNLGESENGFLKIGLKQRVRDSNRISDDDIYEGFAPGSYSMDQVLFSGQLDPAVEGIYTMGPVPGEAASRAFFADNHESFLFNELRTRERADPNTYTAEETVDSLYAMYSWERENWRSILGWRQEQTNVTFNASEVIVGPDTEDRDSDGDIDEIVYLGTNPTIGDNSYTNDFPNVHLLYRWNNVLSIIGSYTNTIERPEYGDVVPYRRVNRDEFKLNEGNPALRPTLYENFDLSFDFAFNSENTLSVEVFRRSVEDIVFSSTTQLIGGVYNGYERNRDENGPTATVSGGKVTWQRPLQASFLPEGLSLNVNYVANDTETIYPNRPSEVLTVADIPDSELNLTLNYQTDKIFMQLLYERTDTTLRRVADVPSEDRFNYARNRINLDFSYKLNPKLRYFLVARDLRSEPNRREYEGDKSRPVFYRNFHWSIRTGFKFEI